MKGEKTMENRKYGVDYIYEKHGKAVIEREFLADQAAHWKCCYDELKKETDEKIAKLEKDLAATKETEDLWYNEYSKKKTEVEQLKLQIKSLEEQTSVENAMGVADGEDQAGDDF